MEGIKPKERQMKYRIRDRAIMKLKKIKNLRKNFKSNTIFNSAGNLLSSDESNNDQNLPDTKNQFYEDTTYSKNFNNDEESYENSSETDFSSGKSQEHILNKFLAEDTCNNIDDDINCFNDIEEEGSEEFESDKENEKLNENTDNKLTNIIKSTFIETKYSGRESISNMSEASTVSSINKSNLYGSLLETMDYELTFYRSGEDIRKSYLAKLISKKVWNPNHKEKKHNSIIIFDWDDTLLPTSFLSPGGTFNLDIKLSKNDREYFTKIEKEVSNLLNSAIEKGEVFIITNADKGWVEFSAKKFYPSIIDILPKIKIISAREEYGKIYPGDSGKWKIQTFLDLQKYINLNLVTNLLCFGDSIIEIKAGRILASKFREAFIKTIKFKEAPKLDDLLKQLNLVNQQFNYIYSSIKNLTIKVEKKKN